MNTPLDVFPAIEDVLSKHCRGRIDERTTRENIATIVDRICELAAQDVQEIQRLRQTASPAAPDEWLKVIHAIGVEAMTAQSDPNASADHYRKALIGICNMALKAQDALKAADTILKAGRPAVTKES